MKYPASVALLLVLLFLSCSKNSEEINPGTGEINCNQDFGVPSSSKYVLPFKSGESFRCNQSYCPSNPNWGHYNWFAYDFEMPIGTELVAMRSGEVLAVQSDKEDNVLNCGANSANFIFVAHADNTVAAYVHLTKNGVIVNKGDQVTQGQVIGKSGNSGCSSGPHVHVNIFSQRGPYERQYSAPFNFSNAEGLLDANKGLLHDQFYTAL